MRTDSCCDGRMTRRLTLLLLSITLAGCVTSWDPPPPRPAPPPPQRPAYVPAHLLVQSCREIAPRVHPWRARQIHSAILRFDLSRAYRRGAEQMKPLDRQRAEAQEREAWSILWDTCQPVLARAPQAPAQQP